MRYFIAAVAFAAFVALPSFSEKGPGARAAGVKPDRAEGEAIRIRGGSGHVCSEPGQSGSGQVAVGPEPVSWLREPLDVGGKRLTLADDAVAPGAVPAAQAGIWPTWPESASVEVLRHNRLVCRVLVYSTLEEVWQRITTVRSFVLWYPPWKSEQDMTRALSGVGDTLSYLSGTGCRGRSVVTWYEPLQELRIVHELADGELGGSLRFRIEQAEKGVGLVVEEVFLSPDIDIHRARRELCKRTILIKRLAEGE